MAVRNEAVSGETGAKEPVEAVIVPPPTGKLNL